MADISVPRIFFDTNEGTQERGYWLGFDQSQKDLNALRPEISEGMQVVIYMPDELEMSATLKRDGDGFWLAMPIPGTIKYLDGSA